MTDALLQICYIIGPFIISALIAPKVMATCEKMGLVDQVTHRSSHTRATLKGGGLGLVLILVPFSLALIHWTYPQAADKPFLIALFLTGLIVALTGLIDDLKGLPPIVRLIVHGACAGVCLYFLPQVFGFIPSWLEKTIFLLAWVWFINLFNFMDGIDGLATSEAAFLALALSVFYPPLQPVALVITGACIGFLRVNWNPAKIFLGDVGSTFLGFVIGGLLLLATDASTIFTLLTITLIFTGDATITLFRRLFKGQKPWEAHRDHYYQRAVRCGFSHADVVKGAVFANAILFMVALFGHNNGWGPVSLFFGIGILLALISRIKHFEG